MTNYVVQPLDSPDIEDLGIYFYTPILSPTVVDTRLPSPANDRDTINGFLTIESAGYSKVGVAQWDMSFVLHAYSPEEAEASDISRKAMAYGTVVQGMIVMGWYVVGLVSAVGGVKLLNPDVPELARYRSALTWRVAGKPIQ
jgi:hypothetical protein